MAFTASLPNTEATNSLVVTFDTFCDEACSELRTKLEDCGALCHFAKLKSFRRCLAVFTATADAQVAMARLNSKDVVPGNAMHMYFSMHTSLQQTRDSFLHVPTQEKLWLISPPGSPPIDWKQTRELPPNATHLDRRLEAALKELSIGQFVLDPNDASDYDSAEEDKLGAFSLGESAIQNQAKRQHSGINAGGVDEYSTSSSSSSSSSSDSDSGNEDNGSHTGHHTGGGKSKATPRANGQGKQASSLPTILIQGYGETDGSLLSPHGSVDRSYQPTARPPI